MDYSMKNKAIIGSIVFLILLEVSTLFIPIGHVILSAISVLFYTQLRKKN